MSADPPPQRSRFGALRSHNYRLLWLSLIFSNTGTWMQNTAQGWLVYQLTGRPFDLGIVAFSFALPMILIPAFGGVVADLVNRTRLLTLTQTLAMLFALLLTVLTITGLIQIWQIVLLSFAGAMLLAFDNPPGKL